MKEGAREEVRSKYREFLVKIYDSLYYIKGAQRNLSLAGEAKKEDLSFSKEEKESLLKIIEEIELIVKEIKREIS